MREQKGAAIGLPIEFHVPEDITCQYATNLVVQHTPHEFIISFFRATPPMVLGSTDEVKDQLQQLESIPARCVARVVVASSKMPEFVDVLQENLNRYLARGKEEEEE